MPKLKPFSFDAIGTQWWVESLNTARPLDSQTKHALMDTAEEFDRLYSRFRPYSLIGRLNTYGRLSAPPQELLDMFSFSEEMFYASEGAFNITVGGTLHRLGYGSRDLAAPVREDVWRDIHYDKREIRLPDNVTVDTGGFGRGWLIDKLARLMRRKGYYDFLVNGGGDIFIESKTPVEIALEHPHDPKLTVGSTLIKSGALAVSGVSRRTWQRLGGLHRPGIDPVTGTPAINDVAGVYVRASTALIADTVATILVIRPELKDTLATEYELQAVIVRDGQLA